MLRRFLAPILILALTLPLAGCKKTTLDRVGSVLIHSANLYVLELDGLRIQGVISPEKYEKLYAQAKAIQTQAQVIAATIASFPEGKVTRENAAQVMALTGRLFSDLEAILIDPNIARLSPDSKTIKVLRYIQVTASAISVTLAAIFPKGTPDAPESSRGPVKASKIVIELPPAPKF